MNTFVTSSGRTLSVAVLLAGISLAVGCTASLEQQFEHEPNGGFGAEALAVGTPSEAAPEQHAAPKLKADTKSDTSAGDRATIESGPPTAEELRTIGLEIDQATLDEMQDEAWAPSPEALPFTTAKKAFIARNSAITSAVKRYRAAQTRYDQVDYLNDLVRQYDAFAEGLMTHASTPEVMPPRPSWPLHGTSAIQGELADLDVEISKARLTRKVLMELAHFEKSYHDAIYWSRAAGTYDATRRLARDTRNVARSLYKTGRGGYLPVLLADNRIDVLKARSESAEEKAQAERERLAALLELPAQTLKETNLKLDVADPELPDRAALPKLVESSSPALAEAHAVAERTRAMVDLVEDQLLPELSPGTSYTRTGEIPDRSKADLMYATRAPYLAELKLVEQASDSALQHALRIIPAQADERWAELSSALRNLELADGPLQRRTREAQKVAEDGFRAGEVSFVTLNESLTAVLETDLDVHRYRRDAAVANALLRVTTGIALSDESDDTSSDEEPKE